MAVIHTICFFLSVVFELTTWIWQTTSKEYKTKSIPFIHWDRFINFHDWWGDNGIFYDEFSGFFICLWLHGLRKEGLRKRGNLWWKLCTNNWKRKELGFPKLTLTPIQLSCGTEPNNLFHLFSCQLYSQIWSLTSTLYADSTKTRAQALHKTRTFSIKESSETWRGNAEGNGRKEEEGERRSPDEDVQGTANPERVS